VIRIRAQPKILPGNSLKGHDFSGAAKGSNIKEALAAEGRFYLALAPKQAFFRSSPFLPQLPQQEQRLRSCGNSNRGLVARHKFTGCENSFERVFFIAHEFIRAATAAK